MEKQDRRVKRTQNLLAKALIALTLEKGYETVTIREITDRADVGYATFFRHYLDKAALLQDVVELLIEELRTLLEIRAQDGTGRDSAQDGTLIFRYVQEHSELCRVLLSSQGPAALLKPIRESSMQQMMARQAAQRSSQSSSTMPEQIVPVEILANHLAAASLALIQWWLEQDMPYPPERMGQIYDALIRQPLQNNYE
jgi:AcrR family transcriptional regulator